MRELIRAIVGHRADKPQFLNPHVERLHRTYLERLRDPETRDEIRNKLRKALEKDRKANENGGETATYSRRRITYSISDYGVDIHRHIRELLETRDKVHILDLGAGDGNYLALLKHFFGNRVHTTAMGLTTTPQLKHKLEKGAIDRIIQRSLEGFTPDREYDLIVSYWGGLHYVTQGLEFQYAEMLAHSLSKGGRLIIYPYHGELRNIKDLRFRIKVEKYIENVAVVTKIG
ncbi:MAG: hypothetical protein PHH82_02640 [Candidatus ainarchaeum sp.]|nr:hypothetical protein [Candidatus ainarchaeum sp.]